MIDITVELSEDLPAWPGSVGFRFDVHVDEYGVRNSELRWDPHCGTHIDAPSHHLRDGAMAANLSLDAMIGPVTVFDAGDAEVIDEELLRSAFPEKIPERLLFRTANGRFWPEEREFRTDYCALDASGATYLAERGLRLVGVDYLSIQKWDADRETHRVLMRNGVVIVEGVDLRRVAAGDYELVCLPVRAPLEGAPARVILR